MIDVSEYIDRLEKLKPELHKRIEGSVVWKTAIGIEVIAPDTICLIPRRSDPFYMMFPSGIAMEVRFYYYNDYL